jgi:hypothetical protein
MTLVRHCIWSDGGDGGGFSGSVDWGACSSTLFELQSDPSADSRTDC